MRLVGEWRIEGTSGGVSCNREGEGEVLAKIAFTLKFWLADSSRTSS